MFQRSRLRCRGLLPMVKQTCTTLTSVSDILYKYSLHHLNRLMAHPFRQVQRRAYPYRASDPVLRIYKVVR